MLTGSFVLVLIGVVGFAAAGKLTDVGRFAGEVAGYRLVGHATAVARAVIAAELVVVVLLVVPDLRRVGAWLAAALFAVFLAASVSVLARGLSVRCGCFGGTGELETVGAPTVVRTALLLGLALAVAAGPESALGPWPLLLAGLVAVLVFLLAELTRLVQLIGSEASS